MASSGSVGPVYAYANHPLLEKPYPLPKHVTQERFDDALSYKAKPGEVFICTYPKCGTTWLMTALYIMRSGGKPLAQNQDINEVIPHLEFDGRLPAENASGCPKFIKTHLYFEITPWNEETKYIFIARNPKDCFTSFYYHTIGFSVHYNFNGSFDEYFENLVEGNVDSGDFFKCVGGWYEQSKTKKNILFLLYEDLKEDMEREILRVADFLGPTWGSRVRDNDNELLKKTVEGSSLKNMRQTGKYSSKRPKDLPFLRKGVIGDWKNLFSESQSKRVDEKMREAGEKYPGFDRLWDKYKEYL